MNFDHRLVLANPHLGWPPDVWAEAEDLRDAELRALRPDAPAPTIAAAAPSRRMADPDPIRRPGWGHPVVMGAFSVGAFILSGLILLVLRVAS